MYNPSAGYPSKIYYDYFAYFQVKFFLYFFFLVTLLKIRGLSFLFGDPKYWVSAENTV